MGGGWGLSGKGGGVTKYALPVIKQPRDAKHSTGNRANNMVVTMGGARWGPESLGKPS